MLGIVLAGGGAKGSYEIGVWKALRKLGIKFDIVTGTSVGALNGTMMVTGEYKNAVKVWENLNYSNIISDVDTDKKFNFVKYYGKNIVKNGANIQPLEELLERVIDEDKFFKSKINFGLVTYNISKLEPRKVIKKDIKKGELKKYIVASSSIYPFFKKKKIDGQNYIDGGYCDNVPINLAIELGATEIIAVDLKAIGITKKVKDKNVKITYITPNNDIGNILKFEKEMARRNIRYGFNDTLKVFKKLDGKMYTFKKNNLRKNYLNYGSKYFEILFNLFPKEYERFKTDGDKQVHFNKIIEECGNLLELEDSVIYSRFKFNRLLRKKLLDVDVIDYESKVKKLLSILNKKEIVKYFYSILDKNNQKLSKYDLFLHDEVLMAIYLYVIK